MAKPHPHQQTKNRATEKNHLNMWNIVELDGIGMN